MAFMMFLMIGTVPGTRFSIPPEYMLGLMALLALSVLYWLFRQRPVRQIQNMKRAYAEQVNETTSANAVHTLHKKESFLRAGYRQSYGVTRASTQRQKYRSLNSIVKAIRSAHSRAERVLEPLRSLFLALAIITGIAAHEITAWARPHLRRIAAWVRLQVGYSVKGTMLSAHRWSSLSKKLLSSLTSLLRRCSSALKRGKSLLTRDAR
jgi:hypothetical protein